MNVCVEVNKPPCIVQCVDNWLKSHSIQEAECDGQRQILPDLQTLTYCSPTQLVSSHSKQCNTPLCPDRCRSVLYFLTVFLHLADPARSLLDERNAHFCQNETLYRNCNFVTDRSIIANTVILFQLSSQSWFSLLQELSQQCWKIIVDQLLD